MSALPPEADIAERDRHVCFVPEADKVQRSKTRMSFNHIVCSGEHCSRYRYTKRFGSLEIDV
jgi:hypothetical protein